MRLKNQTVPYEQCMSCISFCSHSYIKHLEKCLISNHDTEIRWTTNSFRLLMDKQAWQEQSSNNVDVEEFLIECNGPSFDKLKEVMLNEKISKKVKDNLILNYFIDERIGYYVKFYAIYSKSLNALYIGSTSMSFIDRCRLHRFMNDNVKSILMAPDCKTCFFAYLDGDIKIKLGSRTQVEYNVIREFAKIPNLLIHNKQRGAGLILNF